MQDRRILNSWKEISQHLGRGVRTAQRYEEKLGLPVHRPAGKERSAVVAFADEIDRWLGGSPTREQMNVSPVPELPAPDPGPSSDLLNEVLITPELWRRPAHDVDAAALDRVRRHIGSCVTSSEQPLLQALVDAALELCEAHTAGFSVCAKDAHDADCFRWDAMDGALAHAVGGSTPRNWSPCGVTLDRQSAQLFFYPHRYFTYFSEAKPRIVEGLVLPIYLETNRPLGTLWIVSHDEQRKFDGGDVQIMNSLAHFCAAAISRMRNRKPQTREEEQPARMSA
ncbi:MAG TPA: GAF domain-containing protein [Terriglobales bacterium]|nr:GAF domain-containing protein [Terriglobales bacterium]